MIKLFVSILFGAFILSNAYAQTWNEIIMLTASDLAESDQFGVSVAIDGDRAIVGSHKDYSDDPYAVDAGSAYIFELSGGVWSETQKLTASERFGMARFGSSVSISGTRVVVGSPLDHGVLEDCGSAYIFDLSEEGEWIETQKLTASDPGAYNRFGESVSIDGDRVIIGCNKSSDDGSLSGSAYIFDLSDEGVWVETQKLTASDAEAIDHFGNSVSIDGDRAIIGSFYNDDDGAQSGSAYIFDLSGGVWIETQKITASDASEDNQFGACVSIFEDRAIVGAPYNGGVDGHYGAAYIFELSGDEWVETQKLTASDAGLGDQFGRSVSISEDRAVVGSQYNDNEGINSGSAYVFELSGDVWSETQKLTASDAGVFNRFANAVSIDGDRIIIGNHMNGSESGSVYIFEVCTLPTVIASADETIICEEGSAELSAAGAVDYSWYPEVPEDGIVSPEVTTFYTLTGIDDNGCENNDVIEIEVQENDLNITGVVTPEVYGGDGAIDITVTGGTLTYTFDWDTDEADDFDDPEDLVDLNGGSYEVTVEDEIGCRITEKFIIDSQLGIMDNVNIVAVYPNPTQGLLTIVLDEMYNYSIVAMNGAFVLQGNGQGNQPIDLSELSNGTYQLIITAQSEVYQQKIVKQ